MQDTIAAITTAPGEGAVAAIRISGPSAFEIGRLIFSRDLDAVPSHSAVYGKIVSAEQEPLDHVLLLVLRAPRSYTGEDTIEIFCHGGTLIKERLMKRIFEAGARPARPGEFSLRAYLNGKIDLAQAEAVQQLIAAKSEAALQAAKHQLEGALSQKIASFQKQLTEIAAIVEASVDFPEEGLEFASLDEIVASLEALCKEMTHLQHTFHEGKFLHEGISLCLLGSPNVGKSSLMNALLGKERAIVTPIAGTTRDLLEEELRLFDLHFRLIDTAGIRTSFEPVEQEGIRRSHAAMQKADLILLLLDASRPLSDDDRTLLATAPPHKTVIAWNKTDLASPPEHIPSALSLSAQKQLGFDTLHAAIQQKLSLTLAKDEVLLTQLRHYQALTAAIASCRTAIATLQNGTSPEFTTSDLRASLRHLGAIIGTNVSEDILSAIFSKFCLGK